MFHFPFPILGMPHVCVTLAVATSASLSGVSYAQHDHAAMPAYAPASVVPSPAPLKFDSVLSRYKPMTDQKLGSWREANDTVTRIGGWRTYLKEAQSPDAKTTPPAVASDAPATPATPAAANPHAGHGVKP